MQLNRSSRTLGRRRGADNPFTQFTVPRVLGLKSYTNGTQLLKLQGQARATVVRRIAEFVAPSESNSPQDRPRFAEETTIDWTARWWPVHALDCLDPKVPQHVDLLGMSMVIWTDDKGKWHCMEDRCPHRQAPLSEGLVENNTLVCAYHGWAFDEKGKCNLIPQLKNDPKAHKQACGNRRSCVKSFPTREAHGLLWIWPEHGPQSAAVAEASVPGNGGLNDGNSSWFIRDVPLRLDTLIENVMDPSHLMFAHHGAQGNRHKENLLFDDIKVGPVSQSGVVIEAPNSWPITSIAFHAPFLVRANMVDSDQPLNLIIAVPTKPGQCRLLSTHAVDVPFMPPIVNFILGLSKYVPGLDHALLQNIVVDGDTYLLNYAERYFPATNGVGTEVTKSLYYLPANADQAVVGVRNWFQMYGGKVPTMGPEDLAKMPGPLSKEMALDRWTQHTKNCKHCLSTLKTVDRARTAAIVIGTLSAMVAVGTTAAVFVMPELAASAGLTAEACTSFVPSFQVVSEPVMNSIGVSLASAAVHHVLGELRKEFFYKEFVYAIQCR